MAGAVPNHSPLPGSSTDLYSPLSPTRAPDTHHSHAHCSQTHPIPLVMLSINEYVAALPEQSVSSTDTSPTTSASTRKNSGEGLSPKNCPPEEDRISPCGCTNLRIDLYTSLHPEVASVRSYVTPGSPQQTTHYGLTFDISVLESLIYYK